MLDKGRIYCAQIQGTWGTAETDITGSDFIEPNEDASLDIMAENDDNITVSGSTGQNPVILGPMHTEATLPFNMRSVGANAPDWATMAQTAHWSLATNTGVHTLTLPAITATQKDMTLWEYNGGMVTKASNLMFDWEISGEINKKCVFSLLSGKGVLDAIPAALAIPSVTKSGGFTPAIVAATKTILGSAVYSPLSFKIKGNNTVEQLVSGAAYGYGKSRISNRKVEFELQVYAELPATVDPYTAMRAGTETVLSIEFGKTGERIRIYTASANIKDIKKSKSGGLIVWDITGIICDDDLTVTVNYTA